MMDLCCLGTGLDLCVEVVESCASQRKVFLVPPSPFPHAVPGKDGIRGLVEEKLEI